MEIVKTIQNQKIIKSLLIVFFGSLILTLSAKIKIPFYPVPMTMQTFVVLLLGISFGYKIAVATTTLYILEGLLGFPVFSNSPEKGVGFSYFVGPTMGYLIGFIFASFLAGYLNYTKSHIRNFFSLILSVSIIYILGVLWLGILIGWDKPLFDLGVKPFILAEVFKIIILTLLINKLIILKKIILGIS